MHDAGATKRTTEIHIQAMLSKHVTYSLTNNEEQKISLTASIEKKKIPLIWGLVGRATNKR